MDNKAWIAIGTVAFILVAYIAYDMNRKTPTERLLEDSAEAPGITPEVFADYDTAAAIDVYVDAHEPTRTGMCTPVPISRDPY